eukprot:g4370.t1
MQQTRPRRHSGVESLGGTAAKKGRSLDAGDFSEQPSTSRRKAASRKESYPQKPSVGTQHASTKAAATLAATIKVGAASVKNSSSGKAGPRGPSRKATTQEILSGGRCVTMDDFRPGAEWWDPAAELRDRNMLNALQSRHMEWERLRKMSDPDDDMLNRGTSGARGGDRNRAAGASLSETSSSSHARNYGSALDNEIFLITQGKAGMPSPVAAAEEQAGVNYGKDAVKNERTKKGLYASQPVGSALKAAADHTSPAEDQWHSLPRDAVDAIAKWRLGQVPGRFCLMQVLDSVFGEDGEASATEDFSLGENAGADGGAGEDLLPGRGTATPTPNLPGCDPKPSISVDFDGTTSTSSRQPSSLLRALSAGTGLGSNTINAYSFVYGRVFARSPIEAIEYALGCVKKAAPHADALCLAFRQLQLQFQQRPYRERLLVQILAELVRQQLVGVTITNSSSTGGGTLGLGGLVSPGVVGAGGTCTGIAPSSNSGASTTGTSSGEWTDLAVCDLLTSELGLTQYAVDARSRGAFGSQSTATSQSADPLKTANQARYRFTSGGASGGARNGSTWNTPSLETTTSTTTASRKSSLSLSSTSEVGGGGGGAGDKDNSLDQAISLEKLRVQNTQLEQYVIKAARIRDDLKQTLDLFENVDAYQVLGLTKESTLEEAKKAFHKLARTAHPDKGGDPKAFQALQSAYSCIQRSKNAAGNAGGDFGKIEVTKEDGACLEPEELQAKLAQIETLEECLKAAKQFCQEASERADVCADVAHRIRNISGGRSKHFKQLRAELYNELELCARLRGFFSQTARSAQAVAKAASQAIANLEKTTSSAAAARGPAAVNGAALSDRIRICRDSASSCLVMSESLDKIRLAVAQTVDKVAKLSADPSGKSQSQSDRMGKKLLVSSSERVEQTGRRAADEAISCAMKASDVVKGMDPDREDRSSAEENATDAEQSKEACRKNKDEGASKNNKDQESSASGNKTAKEKKLEATTNRLRERHLVLRNKNLSFLSQINDEARDWQSTLYGLAGGRMEVAEKEDLVAQLIEIFDVALWDLAHERGEITQARLEKHFLFLLHLDSRLAVPTDVRSKIFLMAAYADQSMVVDSLDLLRRKVMQVLATKRTSGGKAHVKEWLGTVWQRILGNLKRPTTLLEATSSACSAADHAIWEHVKGDMQSFMSTCILQGAPGCNYTGHCIRAFGHKDQPNLGEECMSDCVMKRENFGKACADCFGYLGQCTFENCAMKCLDAKSDACKACIVEYKCNDNFVKCSGFQDMPARSRSGLLALEDAKKPAATVDVEMEAGNTSESVTAGGSSGGGAAEKKHVGLVV